MTRARLRELRLPALLAALTFAVSLGAAIALHGVEARHDRDVRAQVQARSDTAIDDAFREPVERLEQLALGISTEGPPAPEAFGLLAKPLLRRPEVDVVGYIERVTQAARKRWERSHGVTIKDIAGTGTVPAAARPVHYAVAGIAARAPLTPGSDLAADPVRVAAMQKAAATRRAVLTAPVPLIGRNARGRRAVIAFYPAGEGRFVTSVLAFDRLAASLGDALPPRTALSIVDGGVPLVRVGGQHGPWHTHKLPLGGRELRVQTRIADVSGTPWDELVFLLGLVVALGVGAFALRAARREQVFSAEVVARVAEREAVEADLNRERGFSATLIGAMADGFIAADNRGLIVVNDAMCELTGYERKELLGRRFPYGFWPEDSLADVRRLGDRVDELGAGSMELKLRTKDDQRIPVLVSASRVDGTHGAIRLAVVRDNRERAAAQQALAESEAALQELADAAADMVVRLSVAERIEWVSPSAESVLGYAPAELVGRRFGDLFEGPGAGKMGAEPGLHQAQRKDGTTIWSETTVTPTLDAEGTVTGLRASIRDVTEREEARATLQRTERRYRMLARTLPDTIVFMVDADRRFVLAEGGGLTGTELSAERVEGHTIEEVLTDPAEKTLIPLYDAALAGRGGEVSHQSTQGREYLVRFVPLRNADGDPDGALVVATDVTVLRGSHVMESTRGRHA